MIYHLRHLRPGHLRQLPSRHLASGLLARGTLAGYGGPGAGFTVGDGVVVDAQVLARARRGDDEVAGARHRAHRLVVVAVEIARLRVSQEALLEDAEEREGVLGENLAQLYPRFR